MIQATGAKRGNTAVNTSRSGPGSSGENTEQHWGSWFGIKHYSLEVIQHPIRARMCGFGDKDRRPLAPAAVAKMTIRKQDNTIVNVDEIDVAFFVVTVDLWSADAKHEMNLVLHPSAGDRYVPTHVAKPRRRGNATGASAGPSGSQRSDSQSSQPSLQALPPPAAAYAHAQHQNAYTPFGGQPHGGMPDSSSGSYPSQGPYPEHMSWGYSTHPSTSGQSFYPGQHLPLNHFFHHAGTSGVTQLQSHWLSDSSVPLDGEMNSYKDWAPPEPSSIQYADLVTSSSPGYEGYGPPPQPVDGGPMYATQPYGPSTGHHGYAPPLQHSQSSAGPGPSNSPERTSSPSPSIPIPRHTYTRTLVGPLSANACRLNDEHRKPGIFFLFQDLSIRTEGTFRLRLRLMNVGASPAPEPGANRVMTTTGPILAQTFTDPFVVYSAKRFPGVPDTTALSIAFGNQGQKLPLRNRHGARQSGRHNRDESGSDDDSDGS